MMMLRDKWDFNKPVQPPAEVRMQMMVLDAMFSTPYDRATEPMVLGWLDQAPIALEVSDGRIHKQQLALVMGAANVSFAQDERVKLPRGWLKSTVESSVMSGGPCMSQFGNGWYMDTGVLTSTVQLPPMMQSVKVDKATVFFHMEGPAPATQTIDIYDWSASNWVTKDNITNSAELEQPERFISQNGQVKMRLDWQNAGMAGRGGGCVALDLSVEGVNQ
jgi:hypothetical protein